MHATGILVAHVDGSGTETLDELLTSWERAPSLLLLLGLLTVAYVRALRSTGLGRRQRGVRLAAWLGSMVAFLLALGSPVDALGAHLVSGHMLQHMLLGDAGPALAAAALTGGVGASMARTFAIGPFRTVARIARKTPVVVVVCAWGVTWGMWHTTWAYEAALRSAPIHMFEHVSLLIVGIWLWTVIVDPMGSRSEQSATRIGVSVAALFFGAILTNSLTYVDEPTYPALVGNAERLVGWTSTADQQLAGLVMLGMQAFTIGVALWYLIRRHLAAGADAARSGDLLAEPGRAPAASHPLTW